MNLDEPKSIEFDDLMKHYKLIFPFFYWESNLSGSIQIKMIRLSLFLRKHFFLSSLFSFAFILCILPFRNCNDLNEQVAYINVETILVINIVSCLIIIWPYFSHYDDFSRLWTELRSVNNHISKRLHHRINFRDMLPKFYLSFSSLLSICVAYGFSKLIPKPTNQFQISMVGLKTFSIYFELHALFILSVFHFTYEMLGKFVNFAYHLNRSNLIFPNINNIYGNLKFYKEIHYKLWLTSHEINKFFGFSMAAFTGRAFFDTSYSIYFMFHYWEHDNISWLPKALSIFL